MSFQINRHLFTRRCSLWDGSTGDLTKVGSELVFMESAKTFSAISQRFIVITLLNVPRFKCSIRVRDDFQTIDT